MYNVKFFRSILSLILHVNVEVVLVVVCELAGLTRCTNGAIVSVVTVNLNAKTFIGKRRDRFHPRAKQRCNSVPNLLSGLDSLPACMSSGDSSKFGEYDCKIIGIVMFQCCVYDFMSNIQDVPS